MKHQLGVTWSHLRRSPYQAAAAVMIMTLTIFVGLFFGLLSFASHQLLTQLERKPQVIVFFTDAVTSEDQILALEKELQATGKAAKISFVSKEQALAIYRERNKSDPLLLELVTANTLPASLEVSAKNVADLPALYDILKNASNTEEISYQKDIVNTLIVVLDDLRKFGLGLISFLVLTSIFTVLTVIGMKIALRRQEIEVERLVGASNWYIRAPFLFEGLFYGLAGAIISCVILFSLILAATPYLEPYLSGLAILPFRPLYYLYIAAFGLAGGGLVGIVGSFLAVWRYLKD